MIFTQMKLLHKLRHTAEDVSTRKDETEIQAKAETPCTCGQRSTVVAGQICASLRGTGGQLSWSPQILTL